MLLRCALRGARDFAWAPQPFPSYEARKSSEHHPLELWCPQKLHGSFQVQTTRETFVTIETLLGSRVWVQELGSAGGADGQDMARLMQISSGGLMVV